MPTFVTINSGYLNLDNVSHIKSDENGAFATTTAGEDMPLAIGWEEALCQIIPVQGEWVSLTAFVPEAGVLEIIKTPVIAWALTFSGIVTPVTATDRSGVLGEPAWQRVGQEAVYVPEQEYPSADEWARKHLGLTF